MFDNLIPAWAVWLVIQPGLVFVGVFIAGTLWMERRK